jgi:hypothetical protein
MSIDLNETLELIDVLVDIIKKNNELKFLIKLHPTTDKEFIAIWIEKNCRNLRSAISIFERELISFLTKVNMLISAPTEVGLQAALMEIPVIYYQPYMKLDMSFIGEQFIAAKAFDTESLRSAIEGVLRKEAVYSRPKITDYYNKTEERYLREFL